MRAWCEEAFLDERSARYAQVQRFVMFWIFVSVAAVVLETVPGVAERHQSWLDLIEGVVVAVFTIEYGINIWVAPDRRRYVLGPWGIIDLLAVLPSIIVLLDVGSAEFLGVMRVMRVLRILRVLKLAKVAAHKFHDRERLGAARMDIQIYFIAFFCMLTIWSTLAYYAERNRPDSPFTSIPKAMWWGIVTLTTTGYGDMYPTTVWGRVVAACTMVSGLALFGLLMNVIGEALQVSLFGHAPARAKAAVPAAPDCPTCGRPWERTAPGEGASASPPTQA